MKIRIQAPDDVPSNTESSRMTDTHPEVFWDAEPIPDVTEPAHSTYSDVALNESAEPRGLMHLESVYERALTDKAGHQDEKALVDKAESTLTERMSSSNWISKPKPFNGKGNILLWIMQMGNFLSATRPEATDSEITLAISTNLEGHASDYAISLRDEDMKLNMSSGELLGKLRALFSNYDDQYLAENELYALVRNRYKGSLSEYIRDIQNLFQRIGGLPDKAKRIFFMMGLPEKLKKEVDTMNPRMYEEAQSVARRRDVDYARDIMIRGSASKIQQVMCNENAMDIDAFEQRRQWTPMQKEQLEHSLCFYCNEKGHIVRNCPRKQ
ncbi:hypothetical protein COEREDRAFT_11917, partial [Coemansia reversa NRRL 1564]